MLRVLEVSADQTFFLAISVMDRYFIAASRIGGSLKSDDLHLLALVAIYISSKFEDVVAIPIQKIEKDAGHGKYSILDII